MSRQHIQLDHLSVGYDGKALIRDICIDIQRGEIVTLIGPNGAGKSTILKSIVRQLSLIGGTVYFDRKDMKQFSGRQLASKMAVVLTERMKPELMTCYDVVATGRYPYTGSFGILAREDEDKVFAAMKAVHAQEIGLCRFTSVSDGQRQRVLLARAICQEPEVMILDEPTSFLDVKHKLELLSILRNMAEESGITVIMSLHEIDLAEKISDKIICVKGERIFRYGRPEEIFAEDLIRELYDIDNGHFDPVFGSVELPGAAGEPEVFVLSACGTGIPVYRALQKKGIPFAAGILYTNDIDYRLARLLAVQVVAEEPFADIGDAAYEEAVKLVQSCGAVLDAGVQQGACNQRIQGIFAEARSREVLHRAEDFLK